MKRKVATLLVENRDGVDGILYRGQFLPLANFAGLDNDYSTVYGGRGGMMAGTNLFLRVRLYCENGRPDYVELVADRLVWR